MELSTEFTISSQVLLLGIHYCSAHPTLIDYTGYDVYIVAECLHSFVQLANVRCSEAIVILSLNQHPGQQIRSSWNPIESCNEDE